MDSLFVFLAFSSPLVLPALWAFMTAPPRLEGRVDFKERRLVGQREVERMAGEAS